MIRGYFYGSKMVHFDQKCLRHKKQKEESMEVVIAIGIALMIMYFVVRWVLIKKGKM